MTDTQTSFQGLNTIPGAPQYAGFWWRFLAAFIDGIIMQIASMLMGFFIGLAIGIGLGLMQMPGELISVLGSFVAGIAGLVLSWLYHAMMESSPKQATLGKMICKIKVTDLDGGQLTFKRATGRYFGKILSSITLMIGYIMAAFTEKKQALHDMMAGTLVVRDNA